MSSLVIPNCDRFRDIIQNNLVNGGHACVKCGIKECKWNYRHEEFLARELPMFSKKVKVSWFV